MQTQNARPLLDETGSPTVTQQQDELEQKGRSCHLPQSLVSLNEVQGPHEG